jgi:hypothetical protein
VCSEMTMLKEESRPIASKQCRPELQKTRHADEITLSFVLAHQRFEQEKRATHREQSLFGSANAIESADMLTKLIIGFGLMALCVVIHAVGLTAAIRYLRRSSDCVRTFWGSTCLLIAIAGCAIFVHLLEITVWAVFYVWTHAMLDMDSALYFSAVTYTTVGYGDVVLPREWHLVGGVEALTGILMCGWSTAFFFAVVSRMYQSANESGAGVRP